MAGVSGLAGASAPSLRSELRYGLELARLVTEREFLRPRRDPEAPPVLLVPGFMAGDQSLRVLAGWLHRRGTPTAAAGIRMNVGCAERMVAGIEARVRTLAERTGKRIAIIGQSRGGALARVAAVRNPELVGTLAMLGSPVLDPLSVAPAVLGAVRSVARLGDLGVPGLFSTECRDGDCCAAFRTDLMAPLPDDLRAVAVYSRSDGIVSWEACLDPYAECVEVDSSHAGMSVNLGVYRVLTDVLGEYSAGADATTLEQRGRRWSG
jgi:triacylglycerol lipase